MNCLYDQYCDCQASKKSLSRPNVKLLLGMNILKEICPRGNNKVVILYFLIHDKGLLFMLKLY